MNAVTNLRGHKLEKISLAIKGIVARNKEASVKTKGSWLEIGLLLEEAQNELPGDREYGRWREEQHFGLKRGALLKCHQAALVFTAYHDTHQLPNDYNMLAAVHSMPPEKQQQVFARWDKGECKTRKPFQEEYVTATPKRDAAQAAKTAEQVGALEKELEAIRLSLPQKYQAQIARAHDILQRAFQIEVAAQVEKRVADKTAELDREIADAAAFKKSQEEKDLRYTKLVQDFSTFMTYDDFKMIRGCLHSDHQERSKEKLDKAFAIFKKLESAVNKHIPIAELRNRGWAHRSPFYKKAPRST